MYQSINQSIYLSICTTKPEKRSVRVDAARSTHSTEDMVQVYVVFARGQEPYADM